MGLFSRKRRGAEPDDAPGTDSPVEEQDAEDRGSEDAAEEQDEPPARPEHLSDGPYDALDAPEADRIDLGGLLVPKVEGLELRMEVDQRTQAVTGANLVLDGSSVQLQAFAAPKSRGLWDEVRTSLRSSVVKQGGTAETRPGPFGTELVTRLPVKRPDGRSAFRRARFLGVDGRRWFLRAIITGKALTADAEARRLEELISRLVVVRGDEAMPPQELIPLHLPGKRPGPTGPEEPALAPLGRGPEITEVGG